MSKRPTPPPPADVKRCAVYTRKSTSAGLKQEFNSLHAQREACVAYISRQPGWRLLADAYDDGGFTGANTDRPAFQRLMTEVEAGRIDVIVVYKVDRLSRSLLDFAKVMERLNAAGASFVSVTQNFSTADAMGRLTLNMLMSFAEFEREMIAERTRDKIAASRRKGKWTGGSIPFGYCVDEKKLAVNEAEAAVVREAFRVHLQLGQMALLARELNTRCLLPRRRSMSVPGKPTAWTKDSIARIICNPLYVGVITNGTEQYQGEHSAIIDEATWQASQQIVKQRSRLLASSDPNPEFLLSGLLRCGQCNGAMCPNSTHKDRQTYRYYRCATRDKRGKCACSAAPVAAAALEGYVVERITEVVRGGDFVKEAYARVSALVDERLSLLKHQQQSLAARVGEASAHSSRLADEWVNAGPELRAILGQRLTTASAEVAQLEVGISDVRRQHAMLSEKRVDVNWVRRALGNFEKVWETMTLVNQGRLLRALVDRVVMNGATGDIDIHLAHLDESALPPLPALEST